MNPQTVVIGWFELSLATLLILAAGLLSLFMTLGLVKTLAISTLRTYLQLIALGFVLVWIFDKQNQWIVLAAYLFMILMTSRIVLQRVRYKPDSLYAQALTAIFISSVSVTAIVTQLVIQIDPWYDPRYILTLGGMILGNSMNGIALALERFFSDLQSRREEITQMLAFGATPWEASLPSIRASLTAGLLPTINTMNAAGIVFVPGMMSGQLLAGADPLEAAKYQIVVMLMLSATTSIGAMLTVLLSYRKAFDAESRLITSKLR